MKTFKKISITIFGLFCLFFLVSCNYLDKDPDTELTMDAVYDNTTDVEDALAYVYAGLPNPCYGWGVTIGYEIFADDITLSKRWETMDSNMANLYKIFGSWTSSTSWGGDFWTSYPKRIRESYLFRENVKAIPDEDLSQSEVDNMKAECRFLAAYYWWNLAKTYGPIPFKPDYIWATDSKLSDLQMSRTPFDDIVNYCDSEMLAVSKILPAVYTDAAKYGRITSIMCLTERARMLLFAASPLCNGNSWYSNYTNSDGTHLFSTTYDQNKWVKAAEAYKELIDAAEAAGYSLFVEYNDDGTVDPFKSCEDMFFTKWTSGNKEILFPYSSQSSSWLNYTEFTKKAVPPNYGGGGGMGVYQGLVDAFFMKNGLPITDSNSGYEETGFSSEKETRDTKWTEGTGTSGEVTAADTYNMYCNREPRFYTTVSYNGSWFTLGSRKYSFYKNGSDNNYTWDAPQNGYLLRKKIYPYDNPKTSTWNSNRPLWLYRLGGAYLDYAEAENEAYDNSSARQISLTYLNKIRVRAGVRQYTTGTVDANDENYIHVEDNQEAVRKIIRMERRVELCCEGVRWDDIRRWKDAENLSEMTGDDYGMNYGGSDASSFYARTVFQTRVWKKAYYWMPISTDEIDKDPNLVQSPFWN